MTTAVVILNYNGLSLMRKYLPSVIANTPEAEIIIADNGSTDGSLSWLSTTYPTLRTISFDKNYGFAEGYNRALAQIKADIYVLLNSDVETPSGWLAPLTQYLQSHPDCAACQPKILSDTDHTKFEYAGAAGGFLDIYGYPFCRGRVMEHVETDHHQYDVICEILWASGACLAIKSEIYHSCGGLDSRFFAHQEEIDLCWRIKARGWSIKCIPQSTIFHLGGGSLGYESPLKTKLNFRNNALLLYKNLDNRRYRRIAPLRKLLDYVAAFRMLCQGKTQNAKAVFAAHSEFKALKADFTADRINNLKLTTVITPSGFYTKLLIFQSFLRHHNTFNLLKPHIVSDDKEI